MKKLVPIVLALPLLPLLWLGWAAYDNSVRWGTSDPCGMVAERLRQDMLFNPLCDSNPLIHLA